MAGNPDVAEEAGETPEGTGGAATGEQVLSIMKTIGRRLIEPLREDDDLENFRLSIPETQTTTIDGDTGWAKRPPAVLRCPRCEEEFYHHHARDAINCPHCVAEFDPEDFPDLELLYMTCPRCKSRMDHGQRHPNAFDVPEWASCNGCRYHWEFKHSY
jgi:Zn finger protein HypA/HybF involved in hydrogenase expression